VEREQGLVKRSLETAVAELWALMSLSRECGRASQPSLRLLGELGKALSMGADLG
jgi:hypothetical protein